MLALRTGGGNSILGPLGDQAPLEMRDRCEDMKNQLAGGRVRVDRFLQAEQGNDGRQPSDLTAEKLLEHSRLPLAWHDQRIVLGFSRSHRSATFHYPWRVRTEFAADSPLEEVDSNPRSPVEDSTFSRPPGNRRLRNRPGSQNRVLTITSAGFTVRRAGLASNAGRPIHVLDQIL